MIVSPPGIQLQRRKSPPPRSAREALWRNSRSDILVRWLRFKRVLDVSCAILFLIIFTPLFALIAAAVRLISPGPVFFSQARVGKNGKIFQLYKFRTMVDGAHLLHSDLAHLNEIDGPALKIANDPRLHSLGAFLRRSSLDELPQLWNVLRGDMSLVGPRPALPSEVSHYQPHYYQRLTVLPGMTGLWQVSGRTNVPFRRWMAMDVWYVRHWTPFLDLWILLRTLPAVLRREGAW